MVAGRPKPTTADRSDKSHILARLAESACGSDQVLSQRTALRADQRHLLRAEQARHLALLENAEKRSIGSPFVDNRQIFDVEQAILIRPLQLLQLLFSLRRSCRPQADVIQRHSRHRTFELEGVQPLLLQFLVRCRELGKPRHVVEKFLGRVLCGRVTRMEISQVRQATGSPPRNNERDVQLTAQKSPGDTVSQ